MRLALLATVLLVVALVGVLTTPPPRHPAPTPPLSPSAALWKVPTR